MIRFTSKKFFKYHNTYKPENTILINGYTQITEPMEYDPRESAYYLTGAAIDKLAEYEDAEEQGRLLRLPCQIGDIVHCIDQNYSNYKYSIESTEVASISIYRSGIYFICPIRMNFKIDDFGKRVFATREEAEQALQAMKEGK